MVAVWLSVGWLHSGSLAWCLADRRSLFRDSWVVDRFGFCSSLFRWRLEFRHGTIRCMQCSTADPGCTVRRPAARYQRTDRVTLLVQATRKRLAGRVARQHGPVARATLVPTESFRLRAKLNVFRPGIKSTQIFLATLLRFASGTQDIVGTLRIPSNVMPLDYPLVVGLLKDRSDHCCVGRRPNQSPNDRA